MTETVSLPAGKRLGFFSRLLDAAPPPERYRLGAEQIAHAERHGFDGAWIAQHHFHEDEGGMPAPLVFLGYVAARTSLERDPLDLDLLCSTSLQHDITTNPHIGSSPPLDTTPLHLLLSSWPQR